MFFLLQSWGLNLACVDRVPLLPSYIPSLLFHSEFKIKLAKLPTLALSSLEFTEFQEDLELSILLSQSPQ